MKSAKLTSVKEFFLDKEKTLPQTMITVSLETTTFHKELETEEVVRTNYGIKFSKHVADKFNDVDVIGIEPTTDWLIAPKDDRTGLKRAMFKGFIKDEVAE